MKTLLPLLLMLGLPVAASAQSLNDFQWKSRLVILFTPDIDDPLFQRQRAMLTQATDELRERQVEILMVTPGGTHENMSLFLSESSSAYFYDEFSARPDQFEMALVGLDGDEKYRAKNEVTPVSVLIELIDSMPMRRRELKQGYGNESRTTERKPRQVRPNGGY